MKDDQTVPEQRSGFLGAMRYEVIFHRGVEVWREDSAGLELALGGVGASG